MLACRDNTYFYNQDSYGLLPDDFKIEVGYEGNPFKELIEYLEDHNSKITDIISGV